MSSQQEAEGLAKRTADYVVVAGFAFRAILIPASILQGWTYVAHASKELIPVAAIFMILNVWLAVRSAQDRTGGLLQSRAFIAADISMAVALNLWATTFIANGSILSTGTDIFWQYALGTVFVWTCVKGLRVGALLVLGGALLEAAMIIENHQVMSSTGLVQAAGRIGWIAAGCLVPWAVLAPATRGTGIAVAAALAAGRDSERSRVFTDLHDGVLQTLGDVARWTAGTAEDSNATLQAIKRFVLRQASIAREEFTQSNSMESSLRSSLESVARDFGHRGLDVYVTLGDSGPEPVGPVKAALVGAVREALNNTLYHSHSSAAWIRLHHADSNAYVAVMDDGIGFDPAQPTTGIGIPNSIIHRVHEVGADVSISSSIGNGTTVSFVAPSGCGDGITATGAVFTFPRSFDTEALEAESLGWFAVPALVYRACLTPLQVALAYVTLKHDLTVPLCSVMILIWLLDLVLLYLAIVGHFGRLFRSPALVVFDVSLVVGINILAASELKRGSALMPGHEFLWGYTFGLVLLWTAIRGFWGGAAMVGIGVILQASISTLNGVAWSEQSLLVLVAQVIKLSTAFVLAWLITRLARRGFQLAITGGQKVGIEHARAEELRALFDEAIGKLIEISDLCDEKGKDLPNRLRKVRGASLASLSELRHKLAVLTGRTEEIPSEALAVADIIDEFQRRGLRVELVRTGVKTQVPPEVIRFIELELRKALENVATHSGAAHVVVSIDLHSSSLEVVIRDHGVGFDLADKDVHAEAELSPASGPLNHGEVDTWSEPGQGTRVRVAMRW